MGNLEKLLRWDILFNPEKYRETINLEMIVADSHVYSSGVKRYKDKIIAGEDVGTIVVVKHPRKDLYTVLDGHHRYWAIKATVQQDRETIKINCAVIHDFFGLFFLLTRKGLFQPPKEFTQYVRVPLKKFGTSLTNFLVTTTKLN